MAELYKLDFRNGKAYIGVAIKGARRRFFQHRLNAKTSGRLLYQAWREHGEPMFKVLAIIEDTLRYETEVKAISIYETLMPKGYNCSIGGKGPSGNIPIPEACTAMSKAKHGMIFSQTWREKLSLAARNRSPESQSNINAAVRSPEARAKMRAAKDCARAKRKESL